MSQCHQAPKVVPSHPRHIYDFTFFLSASRSHLFEPPLELSKIKTSWIVPNKHWWWLALLFKKDQTAALTHTCSPRVTLTHILLCAITIETTSHSFSSSNVEANNVIRALCANVSCVSICVFAFVSGVCERRNGGKNKAKQGSRERKREMGNCVWDTVCFQGISHILLQPPPALSLSQLSQRKTGTQNRGRREEDDWGHSPRNFLRQIRPTGRQP